MKSLLSTTTPLALMLLTAAPVFAHDDHGTHDNAFLSGDFYSEDTTVDDISAAIAEGHDIRAYDHDGDNALSHALWGDVSNEVLKFMIDQGVELQPDPNGPWALSDPAIIGLWDRCDVDLMKHAQAAGGDLAAVDDIGEGGGHGLSYCDPYNPDMLAFLLEVGGTPNEPDYVNFYGETLAMNPAWSDAPNAEQLLDDLIALGSDPAAVSSDGRDAFMNASSYSDNMAVVERYFKISEDPMAREERGYDALLHASEAGQSAERLDWLLSKGFELSSTGYNGETGLMLASESGTADTVRYWLEKGFDVNDSDDLGNTAIMFATKDWIDIEILNLLIESGAKLDVANDKGITPIMQMMAADFSHEDAPAEYEAMMLRMIAEGGDLTAIDNLGNGMLHYAMKGKKSTEVMQKILDAGADVNQADQYGTTPIMEAVLSTKDPAVIEFLVNAGADLSVRDVFDDGLAVMVQDNFAIKDDPVVAMLQ